MPAYKQKNNENNKVCTKIKKKFKKNLKKKKITNFTSLSDIMTLMLQGNQHTQKNSLATQILMKSLPDLNKIWNPFCIALFCQYVLI